jgi:UDPglucose--hexose-1-phosphate uridylyltransferase
MSELRLDVTTGGWVIVAPERGHRPGHHRARDPGPSSGACPLCPGHESDTPPEVWRLAGEGGRWRVRVVPNKFPIVSDAPAGHEVIVESPDHHWDLAGAEPAPVLDVLTAYQARYRSLGSTGAALVLIFRNHGAASGTSLDHPHSQVVSLPVVPRLTRAGLEAASDHLQGRGVLLYEDLFEDERAKGTRVVLDAGEFLALVPFGAAAPCEMLVLPRRHRSSFGHVGEEELEGLAATLPRVLGALRSVLDDPPYNLVVNSAPVADEDAPFCWHLRITPRTTIAAGFELATGVPVNPSLPEDDARRLRDAVEASQSA